MLRGTLSIRRTIIFGLLAMCSVLIGAASAAAAGAADVTIRVGHFPNVTHVQALVARALERQGHGWFAPRLGPGVTIEWYSYNAGPSAMEAIFANAIDLTYVGPSPALNAYFRSRGEEVRVVAGAVNGGSALVVQPDGHLQKQADFRGKKIATPQFGNTQDVAARAWLSAAGLHITQTGGDAQVVPTQNPDQLSLFKSKELDAVWTVEPWVSRLEFEAGAKVLVDERDAITTVLVSSSKFLRERPDLVARFVKAHRELTEWINAHPAEAQNLVRAELGAETHVEVDARLIARAWTRITATPDVSPEAFASWVAAAQKVGFLRDASDLSRFVAAR